MSSGNLPGRGVDTPLIWTFLAVVRRDPGPPPRGPFWLVERDGRVLRRAPLETLGPRPRMPRNGDPLTLGVLPIPNPPRWSKQAETWPDPRTSLGPATSSAEAALPRTVTRPPIKNKFVSSSDSGGKNYARQRRELLEGVPRRGTGMKYIAGPIKAWIIYGDDEPRYRAGARSVDIAFLGGFRAS